MKGEQKMTHFEYMEQQGQLSIFDLEDQYEEMEFKKASTNVNKPVDEKMYIEPRKVGYVVYK